MRLTALHRKLLRDLWGMKGQALAIALVVASGVSLFVAYFSNFDSLLRSQEAFYERQRFADVFASVKRAPLRLEDRLAAIPGVAQADTRVVADVTLDVRGYDEPAVGRLVSIPATARPRLDDLFLAEGRWIDPARPDEVLASNAFATAHHLRPGDTVAAVINGRRRTLRIVGLALSPEYVYALPPGDIIPDDRRFGVLWMERRALASAFDMEGGFNDVALTLSPGASAPEVIARLDLLLAPYGGLGAIPRALQMSHWTISNELNQLRSFGVLVPLIFFSVAAFILNVALTRALTLQRPQIAALKALGYDNRALAAHYLQWALLIAGLGGLLGTAAGRWLGAMMVELYNEYFRFPSLDYRLSPGVVLAAVGASLASAALGALGAVSRAVRIPPAEAMQPAPPLRYGPSRPERWLPRLTHGTRMILRSLERHPGRALASVAGISMATAILVVGFFFIDAMDVVVDYQFAVAQRQDATVTFVEPASPRAFHEMEALPGVIRAEPLRLVPARLRCGPRYRNLVVTGMVAAPTLNRIVDRRGPVLTLPPEGLVLSSMLAERLGVRRGESVQLEVLSGERPVRTVPVVDLVDEYLGVNAYMEIGALHRLLREGDVLSGAYLQVDAADLPALYRRLKSLPRVAGVGLTSASRRAFEKIMETNMSLLTTTNVIFAGIIAFGVVYNAARISLSERERELASLRVLGFTIGEISLILLGELAVLTLAALPGGVLLGYGLAQWIVSSLESEVYRLPVVATPQGAAWSALVVIAAATFSGLVVRRRLDHLDLVEVLKARE